MRGIEGGQSVWVGFYWTQWSGESLMQAKHLPWLFLVILAVVYVVADMDAPPLTAEAAPPEAPTGVPIVGDYIADAVGGLYILGEGGLWYARGTVLQRIPLDGDVIEVVPLVNGRAYAIGWERMWLIEDALAKPVAVHGTFTPLDEAPLHALPVPTRDGRGLGSFPLLEPDPRDDP